MILGELATSHITSLALEINYIGDYKMKRPLHVVLAEVFSETISKIAKGIPTLEQFAVRFQTSKTKHERGWEIRREADSNYGVLLEAMSEDLCSDFLYKMDGGPRCYNPFGVQ